jgi:hypothetical protein
MTEVEKEERKVLRLAKAWSRETAEYEAVHVPLKLLQAIEELVAAEKLAKTCKKKQPTIYCALCRKRHPKNFDHVYSSPAQRRKRPAKACKHDILTRGKGVRCPRCGKMRDKQ